MHDIFLFNSELSCHDSIPAGKWNVIFLIMFTKTNIPNKGKSLVLNYLLHFCVRQHCFWKVMLSKQWQIGVRNINNVVIQISWTVSTWEKPAGFVSSSNEKNQHDKDSDSDSEDSENEAQSSETNFKVNSLFGFILHSVFSSIRWFISCGRLYSL